MESTFTSHMRNAGLEIRKGVVWEVEWEGLPQEEISPIFLPSCLPATTLCLSVKIKD